MFLSELKSRISFYLTLGLMSGVLLWTIEVIERFFSLKNNFVQPHEAFFFPSYFVPTAWGSLLWALFLIMCMASRLISLELVDKTKVTKNLINSIWKQNLVASLGLLLIFILLWALIPTYFTSPLYEMSVSITEKIPYVGLIFVREKFSTLLILFSLSIFVTILDILFTPLINLENYQKLLTFTKNKKIALALFSSVVLLTTYYMDANFLVTRRDLSFHVPIHLLTVLASFSLIATTYKFFRKPILLISLILITSSSIFTITTLKSNENLKSLLWRRSTIARRYLTLAEQIQGCREKNLDELLLLGQLNQTSKSNSLSDPENITSFNNLEETQNIIFLSIDTLRADHMGIYGYKRNLTPNLDEFARKSIFCEQGYSSGTNTGHSFASILRSALGDGIFDSSIPSIAEVLEQKGYQTAFITSPKTDNWLNKKRWAQYKTIIMSGFQEVVHQEAKTWDAAEMTDKSIELLKRLQEKGKFFAWIHYLDPHTPYIHHKEYDYGQGDLNVYDSEIAYTDVHIGRLLEFLESSGLMKNTLIAFTSDHGEGFLEHGEVEHGTLPYVEQSFVPLWVYNPETSASQISKPISHIDLAPTMLGFLKLPLPKGYEGQDISKIALDNTLTHSYVITETPRNIPEGTFFAWGLTENRWRIIYDLLGNSWQLYNLANDPLEQRNLVDLELEKFHDLRTKLAEYLYKQSKRKNYSNWQSLKQMAENRSTK